MLPEVRKYIEQQMARRRPLASWIGQLSRILSCAWPEKPQGQNLGRLMIRKVAGELTGHLMQTHISAYQPRRHAYERGAYRPTDRPCQPASQPDGQPPTANRRKPLALHVRQTQRSAETKWPAKDACGGIAGRPSSRVSSEALKMGRATYLPDYAKRASPSRCKRIISSSVGGRPTIAGHHVRGLIDPHGPGCQIGLPTAL